jgi:proline iminopeptidase
MLAPRSSHLAIDGERWWVEVSGAGPPAIVLHGGPGWCGYLGGLIALLTPLRSTVTFDQRGCGRTSAEERYDLATAVADVDAIRAALGVERWDVIGHSFGASLALAYAVAHPVRVERLALISSHALFGEGRSEYRAARLARMSDVDRARYLALNAQATRTAAEVEERAALSSATDYAPGTLAAMRVSAPFPPNLRSNADLGADAIARMSEPSFRARAERIGMPVLVAHGEADPRPIAVARGFADALPDARFVAFPGAGHYPWVERPHDLAAALEAFLA